VKTNQRPEGKLIDSARAARTPKLSGNKAAALAGMSPARWRQIVNGETIAEGVTVAVKGPAETIARMARVVGVSVEQLRQAGRADAADALLVLTGMESEAEQGESDTPLRRLFRIRDEIDALIEQLREP
jgi:hypothetical protein